MASTACMTSNQDDETGGLFSRLNMNESSFISQIDTVLIYVIQYRKQCGWKTHYAALISLKWKINLNACNCIKQLRPHIYCH